MVYKVEVVIQECTTVLYNVQCTCILQSITTDGYNAPYLKISHRFSSLFDKIHNTTCYKLQHSGHGPALGVWFCLS